MNEPTIFERSVPGRTGVYIQESGLDSTMTQLLGEENLRNDLLLPEVSQVDVIRHYTRLSTMNYGVDSGFYPLGSCTMKYNPKIHEEIAAMPGFSRLHPNQPKESSQGILRLLFEMQCFVQEITGMDAVTLQPAAGAHGELTALMVFKRHFERVGEGHRRIVIVPDSSHGTNPATAARCGYEVIQIASGADGRVDIEKLLAQLSDETAAVMLTNPNTLGLFEPQIAEIADMVHKAGALLYCDGANMNAILGIHRPGDAGFDAMHLNLHKTFSTPHGGGGPGAGPIAVKEFLAPYLPVPIVALNEDGYYLNYDMPDSIGAVHSFYGNIGMIVRAFAYIISLGAAGLREVSENAVLNANYLLSKVADSYEIPYGTKCMHEFVASASRQKANGVKALDVAKRLIDYGFHPPTIYFPLIVHEALMIEPTETESIESLNAFADALNAIAKEAETSPEMVTSAPHHTPVGRLDEAAAARNMELTWTAGD